MPDHVLGDGDVVVDLAVVDRELEADEVGQDCRGARLRADRAYPFAGRRAHDRESVFIFCDVRHLMLSRGAQGGEVEVFLRDDVRSCEFIN